MSGGLRHHALNLLAAAFVLAGLSIAIRGGMLALREIGAVYDANTADALAEAAVSEDERSERMSGHALGSLIGLASLSVGVLLFSVSFAFKRRERRLELGSRAIMHD